MRLFVLAVAVAVLAMACAGHHGPPEGHVTPLAAVSDSGRELTADQQVYQALARLTFGPGPGDVARVRAMGVDQWMAAQFTPSKLDDRATERFVADHFPTSYPPPGRARGADSAARKARAQERRQVVADLQTARVARAVMTTRQLQEVMVDFWENHFNVFVGKGGPEPYLLSSYERAAIRPYALGRFRDLLGAVAQSPAMLYYLDNWESGRRRGLNENYGRELLELHTLGVNGGYTQQDVIAVARAFTGWSFVGLAQPNAGDFVFRPADHDTQEKRVLGHTIAAGGGIADGEAVLDILARSPATARFIARKLCVRFVSDSPPPALVDRAAARFTETDGDLRQVLWTIVTSPEFWSRSVYHAKVKTPFEVVVSALRALHAAPDSTPRTAQIVARLGEPIFGHQAPDGYAETGESWMNTGAILGRINFGLALAANRVPGASVAGWPEAAELAGAPRDVQVDRVVGALLEGGASPDTRRILLTGTHPMLGGKPAEQTAGLAQVVGLALGSPEFQRR